MQSPKLQDYSRKGQLAQRHFNVYLTNSVANIAVITMINLWDHMCLLVPQLSWDWQASQKCPENNQPARLTREKPTETPLDGQLGRQPNSILEADVVINLISQLRLEGLFCVV